MLDALPAPYFRAIAVLLQMHKSSETKMEDNF
jgi:hypothetical protein